MIYEMRVYRCVPGKLPALLNRFANITLKIWERHGIKQAGFFTTLVGDSNQELTYFLQPGNRWPTARRSGTPSRPTPSGTPSAPRPRRTARSSPTSTSAPVSRRRSRRSNSYSALRPASLATRAHFAMSFAT